MPTLRDYANKGGVYIVANVGGSHPITLQVPQVTERILKKAEYEPGETVPTKVVWSLYDLGLLYTAGSLSEIPEDTNFSLEIFDELNVSSELTVEEREQLLEIIQGYEGPKAAEVAEFRRALEETSPEPKESDTTTDSGSSVSELYSADTLSWTQFGGDLQRTGSTKNSTPTGPVEEAWSTKLKYGKIIPSPVISGKIIYAISGINIYAIDRRDGDILWEQSMARVNSNLAHPELTPVLYKKIMYFGAYGGVAAIDALTGDPIWTVETTQIMYSSPIVVDETLFIGTTNDGVMALDAATGETEWQFETNAAVSASPAYDDETLYVASSDGAVYALDAETGTEQWMVTRGDPYYPSNSSTPAVGDTHVYVGQDNDIYAFERESGREQWRTDLNGYLGSSPALAGGYVVAMTAEDDVYALGRSDGNIRWSLETENKESPGELSSSPIIADGTVISGGYRAPVRVIDLNTGELFWEYDLDKEIHSTPVVVDDTVYISADGALCALANH